MAEKKAKEKTEKERLIERLEGFIEGTRLGKALDLNLDLIERFKVPLHPVLAKRAKFEHDALKEERLSVVPLEKGSREAELAELLKHAE